MDFQAKKKEGGLELRPEKKRKGCADDSHVRWSADDCGYPVHQ
mgnify:CR=1 FL=1